MGIRAGQKVILMNKLFNNLYTGLTNFLKSNKKKETRFQIFQDYHYLNYLDINENYQCKIILTYRIRATTIK